MVDMELVSLQIQNIRILKRKSQEGGEASVVVAVLAAFIDKWDDDSTSIHTSTFQQTSATTMISFFLHTPQREPQNSTQEEDSTPRSSTFLLLHYVATMTYKY